MYLQRAIFLSQMTNSNIGIAHVFRFKTAGKLFPFIFPACSRRFIRSAPVSIPPKVVADVEKAIACGKAATRERLGAMIPADKQRPRATYAPATLSLPHLGYEWNYHPANAFPVFILHLPLLPLSPPSALYRRFPLRSILLRNSSRCKAFRLCDTREHGNLNVEYLDRHRDIVV